MNTATDYYADEHPMIAEDVILKTVGLKKIFKNNRGVKDVSFEVKRGETVVLMGPNGAGKTTSFRMACGLLSPDEGHVFLNGHNVADWPLYRRAREGMGYLPQKPSVFRHLSVEDNLLGVMELLEFDAPKRRARCDELLEQFDIAKIRRAKAHTMSGGETRRLEIARALVSEPDVILLDEPFAGVDPITINDIQDIIKKLRNDGFSILITDHQVRETLQIADRCYIIVEGQVLCQGRPDDVARNKLAQKYYFGDDPDLANRIDTQEDHTPARRRPSTPSSASERDKHGHRPKGRGPKGRRVDP